jgi:sulfate transport system permease protein
MSVKPGRSPWTLAALLLLCGLALVTLGIKSVAEWKHERQMKAAAALPPEQPTSWAPPAGAVKEAP